MKRLHTPIVADDRFGDCPDCGRVVTFRSSCPFCGGQVVTPGGIPIQFARRLPFLQVIRQAAKRAARKTVVRPFAKVR